MIGQPPSKPLLPVPGISITLSEGWRFSFDPQGIGETLGWQQTDFDDSAWEPVTVPHSWNVQESHRDYEGLSWYRCAFSLPPQASDGHLRLRFQAVFYLARLWLNGVYLGEHEGGYTSFEFDISQAADPQGINHLSVEVDNRRVTDRLPAHLYEGRSYGWNNYGGIVRDVSIELTSRAFISAQRLVAQPHLTGTDQADWAAIRVLITLWNTSDRDLTGMLVCRIEEEGTGMEVQLRPTDEFCLLSGGSLELPVETTLTTPRLWHFDHPHLYRWIARLLDSGGAELHQETTTFGVRSIELKENRFYLNGEAMRLAGLSRHADVPGYGLAETATVMATDFDDLKRLNMVMARPVHYPQAAFVLDYCDRHGILLSPELPAWQLTAGQMEEPRLRALAKQQIREMIAAGFNHPCIWAWSVGNELESDTVAGRAFVRDMLTTVKEIDPTRPVSFASYHLLVGRPWADATQHADFVMMNQYFGTWHGPKDALSLALDTVHDAFPHKTVFISEFGFYPDWQHIEGPEHIDPARYYHLPEGASPTSEEADLVRCQVLADQMQVFRAKPFVAGATFWCYRGIMGVVDDQGKRRGSWQAVRKEFSPVIIEEIKTLPVNGKIHQATLRLHTRGPIETDLPAYTLRGYLLQWAIISQEQDDILASGEMLLPDLIPGDTWSGEVAWESARPPGGLALSIVRPTGFAVLEEVFPL